MAYDFGGILNEVLLSVNETEVTSTEFGTLTGFHAMVKSKVNAVIYEMYRREQYAWPFALVEGTQVTTDGFDGGVEGDIPEYSLPTDCAYVDWESFYVARDDLLSLGSNQYLETLDWDVYRRVHRDRDANSDVSSHTKPRFVSRKQDNKFVLTPLCDEAYTIKYEYYAIPTALEAFTDVPVVPERYKQVIVDGVLFHAYMFRDNPEQAAVAKRQFEDGYQDMRRALIPQASYMRYVD